MKGKGFFDGLWHLLEEQEELRKAFVELHCHENDTKKKHRRLTLLVEKFHFAGSSKAQDTLQSMVDAELAVYTLRRIRGHLQGLKLNQDPGLTKISKNDVRILQLYTGRCARGSCGDLNVTQEVVLTLGPVVAFLNEWQGYQAGFNLKAFPGLVAYLISPHVSDLILTLTIMGSVHGFERIAQNIRDMFIRVILLNLNHLSWFEAFQNVPDMRQNILRGMLVSLFQSIWGYPVVPKSAITLRGIANNRVNSVQFPQGVMQISSVILNRAFQHRDTASKVYSDLLNMLDIMGVLLRFVNHLDMFFRALQKTSLYTATKDPLRFLVDHVVRNFSGSCWISLVDHARMFLLAEDAVVEKISGLSGECMQKLLDRAKKNLEQSNGAESENLHDTLEFLAMDPVIEHWKDDPSLRDMIKTKMKEALNRKVPAEQILNGTFPYTSLMLKLDSWMPSSEALGVPYTAIGQNWIQVVMQYLSSAHKPTYPVSLTDVLHVLHWVFAPEDFRMFVKSLLQEILNRMESNGERNKRINIERYREIIPDFLMSTATKRAISQEWVKEIAEETVLKISDPYLVEFLRDVLRAYTQRGKRRQRWKDTVGLRRNIEASVKNPNVPEPVREMLSEIEGMIR